MKTKETKKSEELRKIAKTAIYDRCLSVLTEVAKAGHYTHDMWASGVKAHTKKRLRKDGFKIVEFRDNYSGELKLKISW